jgi:predicted AlkP superfamily pyrophosphatase or phosphodiesterase
MSPQRKLLVVDVAALGWNLVLKAGSLFTDLRFHKAEPVFPALTCCAQAAFRTATPVGKNGMIGNGLFSRELGRPHFWEQSANLVEGERIWSAFRRRDNRVGLFFWQQSMGDDADLVLTPSPIHKHHGGMIPDCYSRPADLYAWLTARVGRAFNLAHYWGPWAGAKSSDWIVDATEAIMEDPDWAPDLLLAYIPHLDYDLQRHGPDGEAAAKALLRVAYYLERLARQAGQCGYDFLFFGDYAIQPVTRGAIFPNRRLREAGLFYVRSLEKRTYPDLAESPAFALADHQVAHVFVRSPHALGRVREALSKIPSVSAILDRAEQERIGVAHSRGGDFLLVAEEGAWFAYPWWESASEAPDYAAHVDIHRKPGYDPCELFRGFLPWLTSLDAARIKGTHGRNGPEDAIAWTASWPLDPEPSTFLDLAGAVRRRLQ